MLFLIKYKLGIVLGNGVAGEIGCHQEANIIIKHINNAGENNGFLRQKNMLIEKHMAVEDGKLITPVSLINDVNLENIKPFVKESYEWK